MTLGWASDHRGFSERRMSMDQSDIKRKLVLEMADPKTSEVRKLEVRELLKELSHLGE